MTNVVLIDAANLRVGGGVQVAASFIDELARLVDDEHVRRSHPWLESMRIEATPEVTSNLTEPKTTHLNIRETIRTPRAVDSWIGRRNYAVAFTIFGPYYGRRPAQRHIVGFADVTSIFPAEEIHRDTRSNVRSRIRRALSKGLFQRADHLIVEAPHTKAALVDSWGFQSSTISVVPNCVNAAFKQVPKNITRTPGHWLYITRAYPHKNLNLLGEIGAVMQERGESIRFVLTLTEEEFARLTPLTQTFSLNRGVVRVDELPSLYAASEGAIFPSLLESFSVTPLEALTTKTPFVASDRAFVRDTARDAAWYCDPHKATPWADAISQIRGGGRFVEEKIDRGLTYAQSMPNSTDRAMAYIKAIEGQLHLARLPFGPSRDE